MKWYWYVILYFVIGIIFNLIKNSSKKKCRRKHPDGPFKVKREWIEPYVFTFKICCKCGTEHFIQKSNNMPRKHSGYGTW